MALPDCQAGEAVVVYLGTSLPTYSRSNEGSHSLGSCSADSIPLEDKFRNRSWPNRMWRIWPTRPGRWLSSELVWSHIG